MSRSGVPILIARATRWPTFLGSILMLFWSVVLVALSYHIKWLKLWGKRNDVLGWSAGMKWWMRVRVLRVGSQDLYRGKCVYLFNHRSWGDFVIDQYVTEGRSLFMSRLAVLYVFPTFISALVVLKSIILFKRGSIADKEKFNSWIDKQRAGSPQTGLSVYPEGHRSTLGESLPLKRGMLYYAFSRKLPVQIVIGANKEAIISEKHCTARLGQTAAVGFSEVIKTSEYADFEAFWARVQEVWEEQWRTVFDSDWEGLRELVPREPDTEYPLSVTLGMLGVVLINLAAGALALWLTQRFCGWVLALAGPLQPVVVALVAAYLAVALYLYSRPVNALQLHGQALHPSKLAQSANDVAAADKKAE